MSKRIAIPALFASALLLALAQPILGQATGASDASPLGGFPPSDILFQAKDVAHPTCPPFGACPPADQITTEYIGFGVDFTQQPGLPPVGVFTDPPDEFGGVNDADILDLITDVNGRIVIPGTTDPGVTDLVCMSGGNVASPNDLLLEALDGDGLVVGSSFADDGVDPDGRLIAVVDLAGDHSIAAFRVTSPTADSYGVLRICLNDPEMTPVELLTFEVTKE